MKNRKIEELLAKYYDGLTTSEDENQLLECLGSKDMPEAFMSDREIVLSLVKMSSENIPDKQFEERLMRKIKLSSNGNNKHIYRSLYRISLSIAATVLIAVSVLLVSRVESTPTDTFSNPELAYAETVKTLYEISAGINRGASALIPLESFNAAEEESVRSIEETGRLIERGYNLINDISNRLEPDNK